MDVDQVDKVTDGTVPKDSNIRKRVCVMLVSND